MRQESNDSSHLSSRSTSPAVSHVHLPGHLAYATIAQLRLLASAAPRFSVVSLVAAQIRTAASLPARVQGEGGGLNLFLEIAQTHANCNFYQFTPVRLSEGRALAHPPD